MHVSSLEDLTPLETSIGYTFKKKSLLKEALTHKSFAHESQKNTITYNERMEFLGDTVLALIVSEYLFCTYPEYTEADLSKIKAYIVQESILAEIADKLNIGAYLRLGKGEEITGGRKKPSLLANAFEAILAAIYLDGGLKKAREFVIRHLKTKINKFMRNDLIFDFKTKFQEVAQARCGVQPRYVIHKEEGPEHNKIFEVKVFIKNEFYGSGRGRSKKAAEQKAAKAGLKKFIKKS
jgi:ribonuclease-3